MVSSLHNSNQDECEPMAWVIPGSISFCSQEQDTGPLGLIHVFNRAENELDFKVNAHGHKSGVFKVNTNFFHII